MDADVCRLVWYSLCKCAHTIMMSSVVCVCVCVCCIAVVAAVVVVCV